MSDLVQIRESLLSQLCALLGEEVALDENGECGIELEGHGLEVVVSMPVHSDELSLRAAITQAGRVLTREELAAALTLNYSALGPGSTIGLDGASGVLVLSIDKPLGGADAHDLPALIDDLAQSVAAVRVRLQPGAAGTPAPLVHEYGRA